MASRVDAPFRAASPIGVFLIDEESVIRAGMRLLIDSWPTSRVVGEADMPKQAVEAIQRVKPDVVIYSDNGRPIRSIEGLAELVRAAGNVPLGVLTSSSDPTVFLDAQAAGAQWVVRKRDAAVELRHAIEKSAARREPAKAAAHAVGLGAVRAALGSDLSGAPGGLTERQREVAILVSRGRTNRQVGEALNITEVTVRHHLSSIFNRLGMTNRFELIAWVYAQGIGSSDRNE